MSKYRVFITRKIPQAGLDIIAQAGDIEADIWQDDLPPPPNILREKVKNVSGLLCLLTDNVDERVLENANNDMPHSLKVVSQMAVGVDNIDITACTQRHIPVGHTPGVLTHATADLTMALLLATARQLIPSAEAVKAGGWQTWQPMGFVGPDVYGSTVGIVGMGRIGFAVAQRLQGFNVNLLYHNRTPHPQAEQVNATFCPDLSTLLAQSDFVILLTALTDKTHHLINAQRLAQMKPTATLINVARGGVVDQDALIYALQNNIIAQAGLDVMTPEPIPADHPLLQLPNATVLPHIGSASLTARTRMAQIAAENLVAGVRGKRLPHCVNPDVYE